MKPIGVVISLDNKVKAAHEMKRAVAKLDTNVALHEEGLKLHTRRCASGKSKTERG